MIRKILVDETEPFAVKAFLGRFFSFSFNFSPIKIYENGDSLALIKVS